MKLKFAVIAATAVLLSANAFAAATSLDNFDFTKAATADDLNTLLGTELGTAAAFAVADGINVALINQTTTGGIAYIDQTSTGANFAAIVQVNTAGGAAVIYQIGDNNRAAIFQHE